MSKTTIILAIIAVISLIMLGTVTFLVNRQPYIESILNNTVSIPNLIENEVSESTTTDSSTSSIDKTLNFFIADEIQETTDFESETTDSSQIKVDSQDLLNLSQSYETNDF